MLRGASSTGPDVVAPRFDAVDAFHNGLAAVYVTVGDRTRQGYVDRAGAFVWAPTD